MAFDGQAETVAQCRRGHGVRAVDRDRGVEGGQRLTGEFCTRAMTRRGYVGQGVVVPPHPEEGGRHRVEGDIAFEVGVGQLVDPAGAAVAARVGLAHPRRLERAGAAGA